LSFPIAFLGVDHPHAAGWRQLLDNFSDQIEITAIMPGFGGTTHSLEEKLASVPRFDTVDALLADGQFEGAVVCLPNDEGPQALAQLAAAGKHILAEKPAAGSAEDVQPIIDAVEKSGVAYQSGYMWRYDDLANRLRAMVSQGRFGQMISVEMTYITSDVKRRGPDHYLFDAAVSTGGFFNWLACHYLDLLLYILDEPIVGVTARTGVFSAEPCSVEDGGVAIFDLKSGGLATFTGGYWIPRWQGENHWCFRGSERWVHWDPAKPGTQGVLDIHGPKPQWNAMDETFSTEGDNTPGYGGARGVALVQDWLTAAQQSGGACRNTPQTTKSTLELIDAIYESSREGKRVERHIAP